MCTFNVQLNGHLCPGHSTAVRLLHTSSHTVIAAYSVCVPLDARTVHTTGFDNRWKRARCRGRTSSDDSQRTFRSIRRESKSVLVRCKQSLRTLPFKRRLARCSACQRGHTLFTLWGALGSSGQLWAAVLLSLYFGASIVGLLE